MFIYKARNNEKFTKSLQLTKKHKISFSIPDTRYLIPDTIKFLMFAPLKTLCEGLRKPISDDCQRFN